MDFKELDVYEANLWFMANFYLTTKFSQHDGHVYYADQHIKHRVARRILKAGMYRKEPISLLSKIKRSRHEMNIELREAIAEDNKLAIHNYKTMIMLDDLFLTHGAQSAHNLL